LASLLLILAMTPRKYLNIKLSSFFPVGFDLMAGFMPIKGGVKHDT
jgi:hypothetical protein